MRIPLPFILVLLTVGVSTAERRKQREQIVQGSAPDADDSNNTHELLSTLDELRSSLVDEITTLEKMMQTTLSAKEKTETMHLVQHYTAQKKNIEREISLIKSIEGAPKSATAPRHILQNLQSEKSVPAILNIFKKTKGSSNENSNDNTGYSIQQYPPYYPPGYGHPYPSPYYRPPHRPDHPYPNDLIEDTFAGYPPLYNNHHNHRPHNPQTFLNRDLPSQEPQVEQPSLIIPAEPSSPPQIMLQAQVQPPRLDSDSPQFQSQPPPAYRPQARPDQQSYQPETSTLKSQQQSQFGQKQGVFIYYPNGVITEDNDEERPSIVDRFGQAIDRFGQAISNLANRQPLRSTMRGRGNSGTVSKSTTTTESIPKTDDNRPRSSKFESGKPRKLEDKRQKLRWVAV